MAKSMEDLAIRRDSSWVGIKVQVVSTCHRDFEMKSRILPTSRATGFPIISKNPCFCVRWEWTKYLRDWIVYSSIIHFNSVKLIQWKHSLYKWLVWRFKNIYKSEENIMSPQVPIAHYPVLIMINSLSLLIHDHFWEMSSGKFYFFVLKESSCLLQSHLFF